MTNPKPPRATPAASRAAAGRPATRKATAERPPTENAETTSAATADADGTPDAPESRDALLRQLVRLTDSVERLARQTPPPPPPTTSPPTASPPNTPTPTTTPPDRTPAEIERLTVLFAYNFLGEVLSRRNFQFTPRVAVDRDEDGLRFTELRGGTFARVRSADNKVEELENLVVNTRFALQVIPPEQAIDAIVVLERKGGAPVAIGDCQGPVRDVIVDVDAVE